MKIYLLLICILLVGTVSALDWDNKINYENNDMTLKITNLMGFGEELGKATLKSHKSINDINYVSSGENVVMYYDFNFKKEYENGLGKVEFIDLKTNQNIERDYYFAIYEDEWVKLDSSDIPKGKVRIGLITNVEFGDKIDGIWTIAGKKASKHAVWEESLSRDLIFYYNLNESADPVLDIHDGSLNSTASGVTRQQAGLIGYSYYFGGSNDVIWTNKTWSLNSTLSLWFKTDNEQGDANPRLVDMATNGSTSGSIDISVSKMDNNNWQNILITATSSGNISVYLNGTIMNSSQDASAEGLDIMIQSSTTNLRVFPYNSTRASWWYFGTYNNVSSNDLRGYIDEIGYWERVLTSTEISNIWNSGSGISYVLPMNISLISPSNNTGQVTSEFNLNCTGDYVGGMLNLSLIIDDSINSTVFNTTAKQNLSIDTNLNVSEGLHNYTCRGSNILNTTITAPLRFFSTNKTLINSETYNTTSTESEKETFVLNVSSDGAETVTANFYYNNTSYGAGTKTGNNSEMIFSKTIQIPVGNVSNEFYWTVSYGGDLRNSSTNTQNINQIVFGLCNTTLTIPYYNITFKDEGDSSDIVASIPSSTFEYSLGSLNVNKTYTFSNNTANPSYGFCFTPTDKSINTSIYIQYKNTTSYPQRTYSPSVTQLTNLTTNVTLYLLSTTDGQYVTFEVLGSSGDALDDVEVVVNRTISGTQTTIAEGLTDASGTVTFWLNPDYSHVISFTKTGYGTLIETLTPTQTTYTVYLGGVEVEDQPPNYLQQVGITIRPTNDFLINNTVYSFNYTVTTSYWTFDSWGFVLKYGNGSVIGTQSSLSDSGGILNLNADTHNQSRIVMDYYYVVNSTYINKSRTWQVYTQSPFGISQIFERLDTYISANMFGILGESGEDYFAKALLSVLVIVFVTGTLSFRYGLRSDVFVLGIIFGLVLFLNNINFIPNPDFLTRVSLGDFLVYLVGVLIIGFIIKEERR